MNKEELRNGLQRLKEYLAGQDFKSRFLEEGKEAAMDSLVVPLIINEELSLDVSCNFVYAQEIGEVLQFYGHLNVNPLFEENPESLTEDSVLRLINALNQMIPVGQFLYMQDAAGEGEQNVIGIRYTMLTTLGDEAEMKKCMCIFTMIMRIYELLCSSLMLMLEGLSVEKTLGIIAELAGM